MTAWVSACRQRVPRPLADQFLDLQHELLCLTTGGKLHLSPIGPNPQNVIDVGTGTGIWVIDFGSFSAITVTPLLETCEITMDDSR